MVGVCLTVIGLFRIVTELKNVNSIGDNLLAVDALAFLTSFILSHIALRTRGSKRNQWLEKIARCDFLDGTEHNGSNLWTYCLCFRLRQA